MSTSIIAVLSDSKAGKKYKKAGAYNFPAYEEVDPEEKKQPGYSLKVVQAAYSNLMRDRTALSCDYYSYIQLLRDYGSGNQSSTYYSNRFKDVTPGTSSGDTNTLEDSTMNEYKRKGDANIQHKIMSITPALKNAVHGMFDQYEEDIYINSVDNDSGDEEERMMYEAMFETQIAPFTKAMSETYNLPIHKETGMPQDVSINELQTYKETGGFKTAWAESMEEVISFTEQQSKWREVLKRKYVEDFLDINFLAGRVTHDTRTGYEQWAYVDPENFVIQYSQDSNFEDAEYAGYFTLEKIGTLVEKGFASKDLLSAAKKYDNMWGNLLDMDWGHGQKNVTLSHKVYDFKIPVFHFQWIDVDVKRSLKLTNKYDKTQIYDLKFDKEVKPLTDYKKRNGIKQEEKKTRLRKAYQCSWVVDSDMVYDYGPIPNQARKDKREAKLSFVAWRGVTTNRKMILGSIIESIIPLLDHLQISWLKYQDAMVKANPGGYAIELRLLQNLKVGGKLIDPLDAVRMFWDKGILPYMSTGIGESYKGGPVMPITRIEGSQGELMNVIQAEIAFVVQMIERITGITPTAMGVAPDADQPVSSTQMALSGTNNILKPGVNGIFSIKEGLSEELSKRVPILCKNVKASREAYSRIVGKKSIDIIVEANRHGAEYGLYMEARPDGQDKQDLIVMLQEAMKRGRDGEASVNMGQAMYIIERIKSGGNFKKLQRQVDMMIRKSEQLTQQRKQENIELESRRQVEIVEKGKQAEIQKEQLKVQGQIAIDNNESKNKINEIQVEKNLEFRNKRMDTRTEFAKIKQEQEFEREKFMAEKINEKPVV